MRCVSGGRAGFPLITGLLICTLDDAKVGFDSGPNLKFSLFPYKIGVECHIYNVEASLQRQFNIPWVIFCYLD